MSKKSSKAYAARLEIDYPEKLNRLTTVFRPILVIPITIVMKLLSTSLALATLLMIVFRMKYPKWWFEFSRELARFSTRVCAYSALLTDAYPSTTKDQAVHLEIDYPDVEKDLNRWMPLVKWLLAFPHYVILAFLWLCAIVAIVIAWFAIIITGRYPKGLFNFVVGVIRWNLRVNAYMYLLVTDKYPPFGMA
jgi:hypothetical protein